MDISDYWAQLVSIIIGLGIADLLMNFHRLIHQRRRVDWDPLPLLWALIALLWLFNYWWASAKGLDGARGAETALDFVRLAIAPIVLFLLAASVLPREMPAEGRLDMRAEWKNGRSAFLLLFALNQTIAWVGVTALLGAIVWDVAAITRTVVLTLVLLVFFFKKRWLEWAAVLMILAFALWRMSLQTVQ